MQVDPSFILNPPPRGVNSGLICLRYTLTHKCRFEHQTRSNRHSCLRFTILKNDAQYSRSLCSQRRMRRR